MIRIRRSVASGLLFGVAQVLAVVVVQNATETEAYAQVGSGSLTGRIQDASTRAPIADCVVTVTSPGLQGEQIVVTDGSGNYRIPNLPPGVYQLRLEKESYKPYARDGISLRADTTIRVDAQLLPESLKEDIVVVARPPTVDVGSTNTGVNVDAEMIRRVPLVSPTGAGGATRSFESLATAAPGVKSDAYGVSVNGASSPENNYVIDGVTANNPANGTLGVSLSSEFVKEVNVVTGGYMPEYGRSTGGILNVVTKSGSNEFHGSVWGTVSPGFMVGTQKLVKRFDSTLAVQSRLSSISDFGLDVGGPIIKDKLWFYVGLQIAREAYNLDRQINMFAFGPSGNALTDQQRNPQAIEIPGASQRFLAERRNYQLFTKFTYSVNSQNRINVSFSTTPSYSGGDGNYPIGTGALNGSYNSIANKNFDASYNTTVKWTSDFDNKKYLLDTTLGWSHQRNYTRAADGTGVTNPTGLAGLPSANYVYPRPITDFESGPWNQYCDPVNTASPKYCPLPTYNVGGPGFLDEGRLNRYQGKVVVTRFLEALGHHVIKAGVDLEYFSYDHPRGYGGGMAFQDDGQAVYQNRNFGYLTAPDRATILPVFRANSNSLIAGGFLQDSWSVLDKFTLNLGLRYDHQVIYANDGAVALALPHQWSPRLGAIFDPTQTGRSKLYVNYARFYQNVPLGLADRAASGEPGVRGAVDRTKCDPRKTDQLTGSCLDGANVQVANGPASPDRRFSSVGGGKTAIDPSVNPQSSDQIVLGGDYDLAKSIRASVFYTKQWMNYVIEDMSRDEAQTYFIGNPGYGISKDFPKAERNYDSLTMQIQKTFGDHWLAQGSYTLSWLRGNYSGLFRPETAQLDPNITSDFDLISLLPNRTGFLPGDRRHQFKLFGSYEFEITNDTRLNVGAAARAQSGTPTGAFGRHVLYGRREVFLTERGTGPRNPWTYNLDTNLSYTIHFDKDHDFAITMDVFNLLNLQETTQIDQEYTRQRVLPIPGGQLSDLPGQVKSSNSRTFNPTTDVSANFGQPSSFQDPRTVRFGMRATF